MLSIRSEYYRDRLTENELCHDFPGDDLFINGLHAMQAHMWNNGVNIDIPVVRVMNTAHFLVSYMFSTACSGDQTEYDVLAIDSVGQNRQLYKVAIIVMAAMLERTEGFRAQQCRNMLLADRDPDFEEGVTLYARFLRSAEEHFAEEEFLMDTQQLIKQVNEQKEIITQQQHEIKTLKSTIITMEEKYAQYNIGTQNNNYGIIYLCSNTATAPEAAAPSSAPSSAPEQPQVDLFKYIHIEVTDDIERAQIHKMVCNIVRLPKMQQICDELFKLMKNRKVLCSINPDSMLSELRRLGMPGEEQEGFSQKNFQHYYRAPKLD